MFIQSSVIITSLSHTFKKISPVGEALKMVSILSRNIQIEEKLRFLFNFLFKLCLLCGLYFFDSCCYLLCECFFGDRSIINWSTKLMAVKLLIKKMKNFLISSIRTQFQTIWQRWLVFVELFYRQIRNPGTNFDKKWDL